MCTSGNYVRQSQNDVHIWWRGMAISKGCVHLVTRPCHLKIMCTSRDYAWPSQNNVHIWWLRLAISRRCAHLVMKPGLLKMLCPFSNAKNMPTAERSGHLKRMCTSGDKAWPSEKDMYIWWRGLAMSKWCAHQMTAHLVTTPSHLKKMCTSGDEAWPSQNALSCQQRKEYANSRKVRPSEKDVHIWWQGLAFWKGYVHLVTMPDLLKMMCTSGDKAWSS